MFMDRYSHYLPLPIIKVNVQNVMWTSYPPRGTSELYPFGGKKLGPTIQQSSKLRRFFHLKEIFWIVKHETRDWILTSKHQNRATYLDKEIGFIE